MVTEILFWKSSWVLFFLYIASSWPYFYVVRFVQHFVFLKIYLRNPYFPSPLSLFGLKAHHRWYHFSFLVPHPLNFTSGSRRILKRAFISPWSWTSVSLSNHRALRSGPGTTLQSTPTSIRHLQPSQRLHFDRLRKSGTFVRRLPAQI